MPQFTIDSLVGEITLFEEQGAIVSLKWGRGQGVLLKTTSSPLLKDAVDQLTAYFNKKLQIFDLPLSLSGTLFQNRVCTEIQNIPFGKTRTYSEIAARLNSKARPVGNACGYNPIPIIIPCHRVVSKKGIGGYSGAGGIITKRLLLQLEKVY